MNFEEWYLDNREDAARDVLLDAFEAGAQSQQAKINELQKLRSLDEMEINQLAQANQVWQIKCDELQARVDVYDEHVKALKNIHENDFNEESKSSYILGNLDGFFECIESDLKVVRDD